LIQGRNPLIAFLCQAWLVRLVQELRRFAPLWMIFLVPLHAYGASDIGDGCAENP